MAIRNADSVRIEVDFVFLCLGNPICRAGEMIITGDLELLMLKLLAFTTTAFLVGHIDARNWHSCKRHPKSTNHEK